MHSGSGSTYVYGYCDATFQEGWGRDETVNFVKNSVLILLLSACNGLTIITALALAMSRDGSSGGVIRMCVITEDNVERLFVPGDQLPRFWEGKEVLGAPGKTTSSEPGVVPMAVES
jgi:20S proteasome subunit beta 1